MTKKLISFLLAAACLPFLVHARVVYKCQSPNGDVSLQDYPCDYGAASPAAKPAPRPDDSGKVTVRRHVPPPPAVTPATAQQQQPSETGRCPNYPYAREGDLEELKAEDARLQATMAKMKIENPGGRHDGTLARLNAQAEALKARIQAASKMPGC